MAAEIIRESILENLREEVPHATAILVDTWEEKPKLVKIAATIYVERTGQKAILIGAQRPNAEENWHGGASWSWNGCSAIKSFSLFSSR
jgi:hypothetical protein